MLKLVQNSVLRYIVPTRSIFPVENTPVKIREYVRTHVCPTVVEIWQEDLGIQADRFTGYRLCNGDLSLLYSSVEQGDDRRVYRHHQQKLPLHLYSVLKHCAGSGSWGIVKEVEKEHTSFTCLYQKQLLLVEVEKYSRFGNKLLDHNFAVVEINLPDDASARKVRQTCLNMLPFLRDGIDVTGRSEYTEEELLHNYFPLVSFEKEYSSRC